VDSGCGNVEQDLFDWEELEDDGGYQYPHVKNPVLGQFLIIYSTGEAAVLLVMLAMEVELHLLLTSVFDRLSRSESNGVATAF
jgi:hypothetical protein